MASDPIQKPSDSQALLSGACDCVRIPPSKTPEYQRAYYRAFYNSHPEYAQRKRDHMRERYHNNPDVRARVLQRIQASRALKKAAKSASDNSAAPEKNL